MATIHRTTLVPSKLGLLGEWLPGRPWYRGTGRPPALTRAGGFRLDDPAGEVGLEFLVVVDGADGAGTTYCVPLAYRGGALPGAEGRLVGTSEHGVLGRRWIYDGAHDPVAVAALLDLVTGGTDAQHQDRSDTPDPSVVRSWTGAGRAVVATPLRVADDGAGRTTVALEPAPRTLEIVRVLEPAREDDAPVLGSVEADWRRLDGGTARGRVAVVR
jgi:hypothetical protein